MLKMLALKMVKKYINIYFPLLQVCFSHFIAKQGTIFKDIYFKKFFCFLLIYYEDFLHLFPESIFPKYCFFCVLA